MSLQKNVTLASRKEISFYYNRRHRSAEDFIIYMCKGTSLRTMDKYLARNDDSLLDHCIDLYYEQQGLCALSGLRMTYSSKPNEPCQISIDRIDNSKNYVKGNVRLVCFWINNAMGSSTLDSLLFFLSNIHFRS